MAAGKLCVMLACLPGVGSGVAQYLPGGASRIRSSFGLAIIADRDVATLFRSLI